MAVTINKTYNIDTDKDIDPFAGTNLDEASKNTRGDASEETYNTYKNTVYKYDTSDGWKAKLASTVKNSDYATTTSIRNQMDSTSTINILQKKGIGTKINSSSFNVHSNRTDTYKIEPKEYTSAEVEDTKINKGVVNDVSYSGAFNKNMSLLTNSANQMTYRDYKLDNENKPTDIYTDMSIKLDQSEITGEEWTEGNGNDKIMIFTRNTIIEAGNHFNRGNDTTEVTEKDGEGGTKIKEGIDINSSKVLDRSMLFNAFGSDALGKRTVEIE